MRKECSTSKKRELLKKLLVTMGFLLALNHWVIAQQNVSYNLNSIPITTGTYNSAFGYQTLFSNTIGERNTASGYQALYFNTTGNYNTASGMYTLYSNTTGSYNTASGYLALYKNTTGNDNTANGNYALSSNTTGNNNTANGNYALFSNTTGNNNTALGYSAKVGAVNLNYATAIGSDAIVTASNTIQLGNNSVTTVYAGVGTNATLIAGGLQITGGTLAAGKVLTSDANGIATWQAASNTAWGLTGNAGTVDGTNFIGTTDNVSFNIRVNNQKAGRIDPTLRNTFYGYQSGNSNTTGYQNAANGVQALYSNTTGSINTANGSYALYSNTTGSQNTANGGQALYSNTTGSNNTANGYNALYLNTTGYHNTASGHQTLFSNTTGSLNTANGVNALYSNTTGFDNTANGIQTLYSNTTGNNNTANGNYALLSNTTGNINTANGNQALYFNTTGSLNTANGVNALFSNTTGSQNTANGVQALNSNTTGNNNTALGYKADVSLGNLSYATAIGANAKVKTSNTIQLGNDSVTKVYAGVGSNAILITGGLQITGGTLAAGKVLTSDANGIATWQTPTGGGGTGWSLTGNTGTNTATNFIGTTDNVPFNIRVNNQKAGRIDHLNANTFYGYQSGFNTTGKSNTASGYKALYFNNTGKYNTADGANALLLNTTGEYNTAIGYSAGPNDEGFSNTTAIGYGATTTADNQVRIGNNAVNSIGGFADWTNISDRRVKKDINETVLGLAFINELRPVTYHLNMDAIASFLKTPDSLRIKESEAIKGAQLQIGFIAQEVEKAAQKLNVEFSGVDKPKSQNDLYGLRYAEFTVPLVKAVQELSKENDSLKEKLNTQQKQIDNILQQLNEIKGNNPSFNNTSGDIGINKKDFGTTTSTLKVYPNPANQSFTLTSNYELRDTKIQLSDMLGNPKNITVQDIDKYNKRILVNNLSAGIYIITLNNGQKIESTKIIIQ